MNDQNALDALRGCSLLKFFKMANMKANTRELKLLIHYRSVEDDAFMIDQMPLRIEVEGIYFITGLFQRGEVAHWTNRTWSSLSVEDYVPIYYPAHLKRIGSQIPIKLVDSLSLRILLFTIARVNRSASLHQASWVLMTLTVEFLTTIFNWYTPLLTNMKSQLTSI